MSAGNPNIQWSASLGAEFGDDIAKANEELATMNASLREQKRQLNSLNRSYTQVFGKHPTAEGALELNQRIIRDQEKILRQQREAERIQEKIRRLRDQARNQGIADKGFDRQFTQFKKVRKYAKQGMRLGRLAMGGSFALSGKDLGSIAFGMEYLGEGLSDVRGFGKVGKALTAIGPWVARAAGPLMMAYFGGELAKAAIASYYQPKIEASKSAGEVGSMLGSIASDPSSRMEDLQGFMDQIKAAGGSKPENQKMTYDLVAGQARAMSQGRRMLKQEDISTRQATRQIIYGDAQDRAGKSMASILWNIAGYKLFGKESDIEKAKTELAIKTMAQEEKNDKIFKEFTAKQLNTPEKRIARFKEELRLSAYELTRSKQRMLAPTV
jgi:hypothetical protein